MTSRSPQMILVIALCSLCISLIEGTHEKDKTNQGQGLCSIKDSDEDCLEHARSTAGGMGGWQELSANTDDKYTREIITDVNKILKKNFKCFTDDMKSTKVEVMEVYTQVVAGLNVCMLMRVVTKQCGENDTQLCVPKIRQFSILAYKPPTKEPVQASDISVFHHDH